MVNSITSGAVDAYNAYKAVSSAAGAKSSEETKGTASKTSSDVAATFERTTTDEEIAAKEKEAGKKVYTPDTDLVQKLKSDAEARAAQMQKLVETLLSGQANQANKSIFDVLGEQFSPEEIAQAKEDVSEDGYYGVKQTSQRILDFATALW